MTKKEGEKGTGAGRRVSAAGWEAFGRWLSGTDVSNANANALSSLPVPL